MELRMIRIVGRKSETAEIVSSETVGEAFVELGLSTQRYVAILNGVPCTSDRKFKESDELVFMEVFSGG